MAADKLLAEWFWTDRWMGSSAFLLPIEPRGLYREMLTQAWRRGARLPKEPAQIRLATACTVEEWKRCWPLIARYWRVDGDSLVNDTQREVYEACHRLRKVRAKVGRLGGLSKAKANGQAKHQTNALAKTYPPTPTPSLTPDTKTKDALKEKILPADATRLVDRGSGAHDLD